MRSTRRCSRTAGRRSRRHSELAALGAIDTPDAETTARSVVGTVAMAVLAVPSVGKPLAEQTSPVGGGVIVREDGPAPLDAMGPASGCWGDYKVGGYLNADKQAFSDRLTIESGFVAYDLRLRDPEITSDDCDPILMHVDGGLTPESRSNAGSFLASKSKGGPQAWGGGLLIEGDSGYYGPRRSWETDAVEFDYDFPFGFVIHYFMPPIGDQFWTGALSLSVEPPYSFGGSGIVAIRYRGQCAKYGSGEAVCKVADPEPTGMPRP